MFMKVKVIDEQHEMDLEDEINQFLDNVEGKVIDIKFSTSSFVDKEEQIFCFSAMILYE
ncbi:MAG: sporulation protein Cse60 [Erysipelotrichia bacterium]|nr:sporulation protein Cse60 [Erysipelotrichia bacterium]NCC54490.1 sporulation protein Cse60 [Erysipelotrichia bacterium]